MLSEGQRNDINYAIPLLEQVDIKESDILADRGYDSNKLMDYIYAHGGEPTIPSRTLLKKSFLCINQYRIKYVYQIKTTIYCMQNQFFSGVLPEKGLNLTVTVTGIFTKKDI